MISISDRAILVSLNISQFNPERRSPPIAAALKTLRTLAGDIRKEHHRRTLPWAEGARILTSIGYDAYAEWMRGANTKWDAEVEKFLIQWDGFVAEERQKLGVIFHPNDYAAGREEFKFRWKIRPVPEAQDFRVELGELEIGAIKAEMQNEQREVVQAAMMDVWTRMRDVVGSMADRLKQYDPENPAAHPFRDTLVTNIAELVAVLPALNLTDNEDVKRFTEEMQALTRHTAQELRDHAWKRDDVAQRAQTILDQMSQFVA